jgi:REP element-mobilizing transposase RayT
VTLRVDRRLRLRSQRLYEAVVRSIAGAQGRFGMHVLHWSVQHGDIHMIVEATHRRSLSRGMQGLSIRMSKALNKALGRPGGTVFTDRYHVEQLRTPREVRNAIAYVQQPPKAAS